MAESRAAAWMPLYIGDYLKDTFALSTEEHGAYLLLIVHYWRLGEPLPDDDRKLAALVRASAKGWARLRPAVQGFFQVDAEAKVWRHKRIDRELAATRVKYEKLKSASVLGHEKRWRKPAQRMPNGMASPPEPNANGMPDGMGMAGNRHAQSQSQSQSDISSSSPPLVEGGAPRVDLGVIPTEEEVWAEALRFKGEVQRDIGPMNRDWVTGWCARMAGRDRWPANWRMKLELDWKSEVVNARSGTAKSTLSGLPSPVGAPKNVAEKGPAWRIGMEKKIAAKKEAMGKMRGRPGAAVANPTAQEKEDYARALEELKGMETELSHG